MTTAKPSDVLPGIPTIADFLPGYESSIWFGVGLPKNTPAEIVDMLNREINEILADPRTKSRFADLGATVFTGSPADFAKLIAEETEKWAEVVKFAGAKLIGGNPGGNPMSNLGRKAAVETSAEQCPAYLRQLT